MFQCCLLLSMLPEEIVGEKLEPERLYDSVNFILSLQVSVIKNLVDTFQFYVINLVNDSLFSLFL